MTKDEWMELAKHIKTAYPHDKSFMTTRENAMIWYNLVMDWKFEDCKAAIWKHIQNSNYPPSLSELKACYEVRREEVTQFNKRVREIFREMASYYPESLRDDDSRKAYSNALKQVKRDKLIEYACKIKEDVIERVKRAEMSENDNLPLLSVCIQETFNEYRRKS